ncbi:vanadium-dependent haloperoxidase [Pleurocapsa sp. PCC 7319]|uniref:vanadium-dependent haloperoxidase n=1 Tax=Pleurocapsa sp. PCC 7319 TaxID=118161 RepID=UPI0003480F79|nr:vanadium-dependent haloperoxidase [Pleurocapsa sp. PCC 7319]
MINLNNFLAREQLERLFLESQILFGNFFGFRKLRKWRIAILRSLATRLTNNPVEHIPNGDEAKFQNQAFVGSFTKGIPHDDTGRIIDSEQFKRFRVATHIGDFFNNLQPDLGRDSTLGWRAVQPNSDMPIRGWESPSSGLTFEMHGPDSHSVTMPPAPELGSDELTLEMAEVYWLALLRDTHFKEFQSGSTDEIIQQALAHLNALPSKGEGRRKRRLNPSNQFDAQNIFRGATDGDLIGPYLSQFLLIGTPGHEGNPKNVTDGLIGYGALKIEQKLVPAKLGLDHMTTWDVFLDVQDAANVRGTDVFKEEPDLVEFIQKRFITYPRDLATYVHFDALYEAYLNACLILLGFNAPVDLGITQLNNLFSERARELSPSGLGRVDGFALFGGPHILNLVTEVSTRALKAVRYQKFNVHCRFRPEALGGWMEAINAGISAIQMIPALSQTYEELNTDQGGINLLAKVRKHNGEQNVEPLNQLRSYIQEDRRDNSGTQTALLPMAFPEGSPMHPAYGAGHATVAGACVTMLKAFFDTDAVFVLEPNADTNKKEVKIVSRQQYDENKEQFSPVAFIPKDEGMELENAYENTTNPPLSVGDELNKIAANISIGRDMAGVHFYSDYIDSLVMGEKIAISVLLEQSLSYEIYPNQVRPSFSLTTFLGRQLKIKDGKITENGSEIDWSSLG